MTARARARAMTWVIRDPAPATALRHRNPGKKTDPFCFQVFPSNDSVGELCYRPQTGRQVYDMVKAKALRYDVQVIHHCHGCDNNKTPCGLGLGRLVSVQQALTVTARGAPRPAVC